MADLSRLSTADLKALQSGNLAGVSTQGLMVLKSQALPQTVSSSAYKKFENMRPADVVRNAAMGRIDKGEAQQYLQSIGSDPAMIDRFGEKDLSAFETLGGAVGQAVKGIPFVGTFADEAVSALAAAPAYVASQFTDQPLEYQAIRDETNRQLREQADVFQTQNPITSVGLQLASGVGTGYRMLPGAPLSKALTAKGALQNLATGLGAGIAYGAGEGETPEMRGELSEDYGKTGAVAGVVLPAALRGAGLGAQATERAATAVKRAVFGADADTVFADVINASKKAPEQLQRELAQGKISTIADIAGDEVQGLTRAVGKVEGGRNIIADALEGRSEQAVKRVIGQLSKNVSPVEAYFGSLDDLAKARSSMAAPLYKEAFDANQVIVSKSIDDILATPTGKQALNRASRKMQDQMALLGKPDPVLSKQAKALGIASEKGVARGLNLQSLDYVKRGLDDMIGEAKRAGSMDDVRILTGLKNQLVNELDAKDVTGKYTQARNVFSGFARVQDAMEEGRMFKRMTPEQIRRTLKDMTPDQREAYRVGMRSALQDEVLKTADKADPAKRIFGNQFEREQFEAALGPKQFKEFEKRMVEEIKAADTKFKVLGGSRTDINLAGDEQLQNTINQVAREGVKGTAFTRTVDFIADQVARRYYGINKANAEALARALVDRKAGMAALQRLIDKQKGPQQSIVQQAVQGMRQFAVQNTDPNALRTPVSAERMKNTGGYIDPALFGMGDDAAKNMVKRDLTDPNAQRGSMTNPIGAMIKDKVEIFENPNYPMGVIVKKAGKEIGEISAWIDGNDFNIEGMYIDKGARGGGAGSKALDAVLAKSGGREVTSEVMSLQSLRMLEKRLGKPINISDGIRNVKYSDLVKKLPKTTKESGDELVGDRFFVRFNPVGKATTLAARPEATVAALALGGGLGAGNLISDIVTQPTESRERFANGQSVSSVPFQATEDFSQVPTEVLQQRLQELKANNNQPVEPLPAANQISKTFVIAEEGIRNRVYRDSVGIKTVGIGFNMEQGNARAIWARAKIPENFDRVFNGQQELSNKSAQKLFDFTYKASSKAAQRIVPFYGDLGANQQAALDSMVFQLGPTGVKKFNKTLAALEKDNATAVENYIVNSLWGKQTPARAKRTALMLAYDLTPQEAERKLLEQNRISAREIKFN